MMDAKQRRKTRRKWFIEYEEELVKVIAWINSPEAFIPASYGKGGEVIMKPERVRAFGEKYPGTRLDWKGFLLKKGISASAFIKNAEHIPLLAHTGV